MADKETGRGCEDNTGGQSAEMTVDPVDPRDSHNGDPQSTGDGGNHRDNRPADIRWTSGDGGAAGRGLVYIRVEWTERIPDRWKNLLHKALQSWTNGTLSEHVGEKCNVMRLQLLDDPRHAAVEIRPSRALDVLQTLRKGSLTFKERKRSTTVHFYSDEIKLFSDPQQPGPTVEENVPVPEDSYTSGDGGAAGEAGTSVYRESPKVNIRVEWTEEIPDRWEKRLQKALQSWSSGTLSEHVGEKCDVVSLRLLDDPRHAVVEISLSRALEVLRTMKQGTLKFKELKLSTTIHFLLEGEKPLNGAPTAAEEKVTSSAWTFLQC